MFKKNRIALLLVLIVCLEVCICLWANLTTETEFVFDKCARNSGRLSSLLHLTLLLMIGYFGLKKIYFDESKKDQFRVLVTLFAFNHLVHFLFVLLNFRHHAIELKISDNKHGFFTFICILIIPVIIWTFKKMNTILYFLILFHLFNVSYFIMETFYHKIKPDKPAYHNQLGILVTGSVLLYISYRMFRESQRNKN
jgi:hypothetical protein